ncbi:hypothetical protein BKA70DRAFT_1426759 [Coprinopsis sp. MPI-PUGE-AT-0042]|nr:hypothetical protein BKA70DRAFT_1426759 [Coprinopsis sp. MPI-PUGE-AT-0042]
MSSAAPTCPSPLFHIGQRRMASTIEINARILPFIHSNDPLPAGLQPLLDAPLKEPKTRISACDARISKIREQIVERQGTIKALERDIGAFQLALEEQQETKNGFSSMISTLNTTTSAVRRLPPEIIARIFKFLVRDGSSRFQHDRLKDLSRVSQLWRRTALSTPSLWRRLSVELRNFSPGQSDLFASALNSWLRRAGEGGPISLQLSRGKWHRITRGCLEACHVINWIQTSQFNFISLEFHGIFTSTNELRALFTSNAPCFNSTKELHVGLHSLESPPSLETSQSIDVQSTLPKLDCLTVTGARFGEPSVAFIHSSLATIQLVDIELTTCDVITMIRGLPALRTFSLKGCYVLPDEEPLGDAEDIRPSFHS